MQTWKQITPLCDNCNKVSLISGPFWNSFQQSLIPKRNKHDLAFYERIPKSHCSPCTGEEYLICTYSNGWAIQRGDCVPVKCWDLHTEAVSSKLGAEWGLFRLNKTPSPTMLSGDAVPAFCGLFSDATRSLITAAAAASSPVSDWKGVI